MSLTPIILVLACISLELGMSAPTDVHIHIPMESVDLDKKDAQYGISVGKLI